MAEPLKNYFGPDIPERIAVAMHAVDSSFDRAGFVDACLVGWDDLELTPRARQIAAALGEYLPDDRGRALEMVVESFGPESPNVDPDDAPAVDPDNPMAGFFYMPHGYFISDFGGEHFDQAMRSNYELTKRFTAEFSVRAWLEQDPERTLAVLRGWTNDENVHVRRLVSEGTRSRLPWASRLREFQRNPEPVIELLEVLKDDDVEYVRRSVANNLNDIAKDHPARVVEVTAAWWPDADRNRKRLIRHGLRTLIKQADPGALDVIGYGESSPATVQETRIEPPVEAIGGKVRVSIELGNPSPALCGALVDLRVHFVKADGSTSPKVFKGAEVEIQPGEQTTINKTISVRQHSTRKHYPGTHRVEAIINGTTHELGTFELLSEPEG